MKQPLNAFLLFVSIASIAMLIYTQSSSPPQESDQNRRAYQSHGEIFKEVIKRDTLTDTVYLSVPYELQSLSDLRNYYPELYEQVQSIQGNVTTVTQTKIEVQHDTILIPVSSQRNDDCIYFVNYELQDSALELSASSSARCQGDSLAFGELSINQMRLRTALTVGFRENEGYYEAFAIPQDSSVIVTELKGAYTLEKQKPYGIGVYGGIGLGYGFTGPNIGVHIGIGFYHKLKIKR